MRRKEGSCRTTVLEFDFLCYCDMFVSCTYYIVHFTVVFFVVVLFELEDCKNSVVGFVDITILIFF